MNVFDSLTPRVLVMGRPLLALTLFLLSTAPQPDRWVHVGGRAGSHDDYVDRESIRRTGDEAIVWTRRDLLPSRGTAWQEIQFDCRARTASILSWIRDDGAVTHNMVRPYRESGPIAAGSVEEKAFDIACR